MKTSEKVLVFLMLIVIAILVWTTRCPQQQVSNGASNSALIAAQATINSQATEMASLRAQLAACQSSTTVITAAPAPVISAPAPVVYAPAPTKQKRVTTQRVAAPQVTTIIPDQLPLDDENSGYESSAASSNLSFDDGQIYTLPSSFYEAGVKGVKLCLRFGGKDNRYWPHIGINDGSIKIDHNIEGNGEKGYNFLLPGAVSSIKGDIGITKDDLTFFVSSTIIDKYMLPSDNGLVEILAPGTGWVAKPLTRFGDYYIFKVVR